MDPTTRKVRFQPKAPKAPSKGLVLAKAENVEDNVDAAADAKNKEQLRRLLSESHLNVKPKTERKVERAVDAFREVVSDLKSYRLHPDVKSPLNKHPGGIVKDKVDKEYKEPWDYNRSYYPVTLPLRRIYSGNPEVLDEDEFGEASKRLTHDENSVSAAKQFGLMNEDPEPNVLFLQLPSKLPMPKDHKEDVKEASVKSRSSRSNVYTLDELQAGFMGKLLVYKSGDVKLKLGDNLYDVSTGVDSTFAQEVDVVNTEEKVCCSIGELNKRLIVTPDMDSLFDNL